MAATGSNKVVLAAIGFNGLIAVCKLVAAGWTGSSAMLAEAIHSVLDTADQGLLLLGLARSRRPPDASHPFGYSRELYFWSFIVAILLFGVGCGLSIYEGVQKLFHPQPITDIEINYIVLAVALAMESGSLFVALREFNSRRGNKSVLLALHRSKDPATYTVLLEDSAAIAGLLTAFVGLLVAHYGGVAAADGLASIVIGLILGLVAGFLAFESKELLIGEAASAEVQTEVMDLIQAETGAAGCVRAINEVKSIQLGPRDVLIAASVDMEDGATAADVERLTSRLERAIRKAAPEVQRFYLEVQSAQQHRALARERAGPS